MPNDASVLAFCWHLKCHFKRRNPLFWHFKSNKGTKTKRKNEIFDFLKFLHVFFSVFSIRCKICNICRSLTLQQKVSVLMTAVFERFHAFIVWSVKVELEGIAFSVMTLKRRFLEYHDKKYNGKAIKIESLMSKCQVSNASWSKRNHRKRIKKAILVPNLIIWSYIICFVTMDAVRFRFVLTDTQVPRTLTYDFIPKSIIFKVL